MLKNCLKGAAIVIAGVLIFGSGIAQGETLPEAIQQVLVNHPDIKGSAYVKQARDQEVVQARAPYFPKIDASASWGIFQQDLPFYSRSWPSLSTVGIRQNVFRGGADYADVKRQKARVKSQAYLLQGTSENAALLTARVYINVLRTTELSELAKENLINHERIGDQVKLRKQSGVDRGADFDQVTGRLALAQSNIAVTTANLLDAKTDYQAVVNSLPGNLTKVEPLSVPFPATFEEAEKLALENHPIVKSAKADLKARKAQYEVAKRQLSPSFDVAANYNWADDSYNSSTGLSGRSNYWAATATVSFNVFNGLQNAGRIKETMYLVNEAEQILNNTERQTVQSIRLSLEAYKAAQERVKYLEEYVKATESTASAFASQWNIGRRTMFDLLDTQAEAINAKSSLVTAKYDKLLAEFRILSGMGKLVHSLGLQWPEESRVSDERADVAPAVVPVKKEEPVVAAPPVIAPAKPEAPAAAPPPAPVVKPAEPAAYEKTSDGFMKADKDGFIKAPPERPKTEVPAKPAPPVIAPSKPEVPAVPPPVIKPPKAEVPAAPAPQAVEPVKQPAPASDKTSDGFIKADKDGFIKSKF